MKLIRWLPAVLAAALGGVVVVVASMSPSPVPIAGAGPSEAAYPSSAGIGATVPPSPTPSPIPAPALASYPGPPYDLNFVTRPTANESQSKLWFHHGAWWGILVSETTRQMHIHQLDWASQRWIDTGVLVDERPFVRLDVLWDDQHLYVVAAGDRVTSSNAARVVRFSYDTTARRYTLDEDFPVRVTDDGVQGIMIARAQNGELWLAYMSGQRVHVSRSASGGLTWRTPFVPPVEELSVAADRVALLARGDEIVLVWTSEREDAVYAGIHRDGNPDDAWTVHVTPVEGLTYGEDELSARAFSDAAGGSIFAAIRTSHDRVPNRNADAAQIVVVRLDVDGTWHQSLFGRVRDDHDGAIVMLDEARRRVYVVAEAGQRIYFKETSPLDMAFASGLGTMLIGSDAESAGSEGGSSPSGSPGPGASALPKDSLLNIDDATSTKQPIGHLTELVLLASDDVEGQYHHGAIGLPDGRRPPALGQLAAPETLGPPADATTYLFRDSFSAYQVGSAAASGWGTRDEPEAEILTIVEPSPADPSLRLVADAAGDGPRTCKSFAPSATGLVIAEATVQARGVPDSDATITTLRGRLGEVASVRFGERGTFRYFDGDTRITSDVPYRTGVWYRSRLVLDLETQTYDWQIGALGSGEPLFAVTDLPVRVPSDEVSEICMQSADQLPDADVQLYVDDVSVERAPNG